MDRGVAAGQTLAVVGRGFVGRQVEHAALEAGWKVRSLTRTERPGATEPGVEHLVGDARDAEVMVDLLTGADHVVFPAGTAKPAESDLDPEREIAANQVPLLATLDAMARTGTAGITLLSSAGTVYGPDAPTPTPETAPLAPICTYGVLKVAAERFVSAHARDRGLHADVLRIANVYGHGEPTRGSQGLIGVARTAMQEERAVVVYGDGSARRDFIHVDDVAHAVVELAIRPDGVRTLNVGSGRSWSVLEVVDAVARSLGVEATLEHRPSRASDVPLVELDVRELRARIDFEPRDLATGLGVAV